MIESPHNEKLKLVRKLRERKHREREGAFVTEGEDLVEAGRTAGVEPRIVLVAAGSGLAGEEVEPELLAGVSSLGSGTRAIAVWSQRWVEPGGSPCLYLHGVGDPGNVGTIVRTAHALLAGTVVLGPDCAESLLAQGGAGEHGLDLRAAARAGRGWADAAAQGGLGCARWRGARRPRRHGDALPRRRA